MFDVVNNWQWLVVLCLSMVLTVWADRIAIAYERLFDQGVSADWRLLHRAIILSHNIQSVTHGRTLVLLGSLMFICGMALCSRHGALWGWPLVEYGFVWAVALLACIDRRTGLLVDALSIPLAVCGLIALIPEWTVSWQDGILAAVVVGAFLMVVRSAVSRYSRSEPLGLGDVKVFVAIGLWIGLQGVLTVLLFANTLLLGYFVWRRVRAGTVGLPAAYPFGPFILAGLVLFYLLPLRT